MPCSMRQPSGLSSPLPVDADDHGPQGDEIVTKSTFNLETALIQCSEQMSSQITQLPSYSEKMSSGRSFFGKTKAAQWLMAKVLAICGSISIPMDLVGRWHWLARCFSPAAHPPIPPLKTQHDAWSVWPDVGCWHSTNWIEHQNDRYVHPSHLQKHAGATPSSLRLVVFLARPKSSPVHHLQLHHPVLTEILVQKPAVQNLLGKSVKIAATNHLHQNFGR